jgi:hypothetical protein
VQTSATPPGLGCAPWVLPRARRPRGPPLAVLSQRSMPKLGSRFPLIPAFRCERSRASWACPCAPCRRRSAVVDSRPRPLLADGLAAGAAPSSSIRRWHVRNGPRGAEPWATGPVSLAGMSSIAADQPIAIAQRCVVPPPPCGPRGLPRTAGLVATPSCRPHMAGDSHSTARAAARTARSGRATAESAGERACAPHTEQPTPWRRGSALAVRPRLCRIARTRAGARSAAKTASGPAVESCVAGGRGLEVLDRPDYRSSTNATAGDAVFAAETSTRRCAGPISIVRPSTMSSRCLVAARTTCRTRSSRTSLATYAKAGSCSGKQHAPGAPRECLHPRNLAPRRRGFPYEPLRRR